MRTKTYEHRCGLRVVPEEILSGIETAVHNVKQTLSTKTISEVKENIREQLEIQGWSREYRLDATSRITISSYYQEIGLCFQTGNYSRVYADMLKLQALYLKENIVAGVILVPQSLTSKMIGLNTANFERVVQELPIFGQVITMPLVVIGFDGTEE